MNAKEYKDVLCTLKGESSIEPFIVNSLKYFLTRSNDFNIRSSCNESLFYQLAIYIDSPEHPNVEQILFVTYGKKTIRKIFNIIKQEALNNLWDIKNYIQYDLLITISNEERDKVADKLEIIYNQILEIEHELNNS